MMTLKEKNIQLSKDQFVNILIFFLKIYSIKTWPRVYKNVMLNSADNEICRALNCNMYQQANITF